MKSRNMNRSNHSGGPARGPGRSRFRREGVQSLPRGNTKSPIDFSSVRRRAAHQGQAGDSYLPQVSENSQPDRNMNKAGQGVQKEARNSSFPSDGEQRGKKDKKTIVVILEKAGLLLGTMGIVDAYERSATTEIANPSLKNVRPDIVHQCLLALFDSDWANDYYLRVYISLFARSGKVIEVSPALRPPRTYYRFRGLIAALLRDGQVSSADGQVLMRIMPGSVAPVIPNGAEVIGITNSVRAPIITPTKLAEKAEANPIRNELQGGIKDVLAFYCISCTDDCDLDGVDYVTSQACLNAYPMASHVMCARICEGHSRVAARASK